MNFHRAHLRTGISENPFRVYLSKTISLPLYESLRSFKIAYLLTLIFLLLFSGWGRKGDISLLLKEYQSKDKVTNQRGEIYKLPSLYGGEYITILKSADGGKTFQEVGKVKTNLTYSAWGADLFCDRKGDLYLVWSGMSIISKTEEDLLSQFKAIFFSHSKDGGKTWSPPQIVNDKDSPGHNPKVFVETGGNIYVSWISPGIVEGTIFLNFSRKGGNSWGRPQEIRKGVDINFSQGDDGTVFFTYVGGEYENIIFVSYTQSQGKHWETVTPGEFPMMVKEPYATSIRGKFYLIFQGFTPSISALLPGSSPEYHLYYTLSKDRGVHWEKVKEIRIK